MLGSQQEQDIPFTPLQGTLSRIADSLFRGCNPCVTILPLHVIDPSSTHNYSTWLAPQEISQLSKFKYNKRATEWLGGRICSKQSMILFSQLEGVKNKPVAAHLHRIASKESGRPYFSRQQPQHLLVYPQLSISHSKEFAAALCATGSCGIDIQYQTPSLLKVREKFINSAEEELLATLFGTAPILARLSLLWAAKEAIKKMLSPTGMPGFHDLRLVEASVADDHSCVLHLLETRHYSTRFTVAAGIQSNTYSIALCCNANTHKKEA